MYRSLLQVFDTVQVSFDVSFDKRGRLLRISTWPLYWKPLKLCLIYMSLSHISFDIVLVSFDMCGGLLRVSTWPLYW